MPELGLMLIVEDLEEDQVLIRRSLEKAGVPNPLQFVGNGQLAMAYLLGHGKFTNREEYPLPALMLLDLKMPGMDGFEVIRWVRAQPALKALRIIVLTSSEDIRDVNRAYELGANSFLVKPMDFQDLVGLSRFLTEYWLRTDMAPTVSRPPDLKSKLI